MNPNINQDRRNRNSRVSTGLIFLVIGALLLLNKMGAPIPGWLFSWPAILILVGFFVGVKSRFQSSAFYILVFIGGVFLAERSIPGVDLSNYLIPVILIGIGLIVILRPKHTMCSHRNNPEKSASASMEEEPFAPQTGENLYEAESGEYLQIQAILGGIKRNVRSKNFKGGEILSFMGGSDINLTQSDMQHPVTLDVTNIFGGTKLIIPADWDIQNNVSAIFGGVEDKRLINNQIAHPQKRLYLTGTCLFGGLEITNY